LGVTKTLNKLLKYIFIFIVLQLSVVAQTLTARTAYAQKNRALIQESFNSLENWKPLHFPKIKKHTLYRIETNTVESYLKATSNASASGLVYRKEFNVYEFPRVMWQWKVDNVYKKGNAKAKSGDDYPLRIYIMFKYDPDRVGFMERLKYNAIRLIHGKYPPHSSLNYIWANRRHKEHIITNPYTEKVKMILLQQGGRNSGKWVIQEVDIIEDYQKAFHKKPPPVARIAIMNDADNTGESSTSYVNYIQVYAPKK